MKFTYQVYWTRISTTEKIWAGRWPGSFSLGRFCNLSGKVLEVRCQLSKRCETMREQTSRELEEENTGQRGSGLRPKCWCPHAQSREERGPWNPLLALSRNLSKAPVSARTEYLLDSALFAFALVTYYHKLSQRKQHSLIILQFGAQKSKLSLQGSSSYRSSRGEFIPSCFLLLKVAARPSSSSLPPSSNLCFCNNVSFSDFDPLASLSFMNFYLGTQSPPWTGREFPHLQIL